MEIQLNGRLHHTTASNYDTLRNELALDANALIVNGHSKPWTTLIVEADHVIMLNREISPTLEVWRAIYDARYGKEMMDKLQQGKVAICGLGGLGSLIAIELGRLGVGTLLLIDDDIVDATNLARQQYTMRHIGMNKTDALTEELTHMAPLTTVTTNNIHLTRDNIADALEGYTIICEAVDRPETKAALTEAVLSDMPHATLVGASGMAGYGSGNAITAKKIFPRLFMVGDGESEGEEGIGLMAPRVGLCASAQATLIMRLLLGEANPL